MDIQDKLGPMVAGSAESGPETNEFPADYDTNRMYAVMYQFAQRVSYGESTDSEVRLMGRVFDLVERRGDWNCGITNMR